MRIAMLALVVAAVAPVCAQDAPAVFNGHPVELDGQGKLLPWGGSPELAYDRFLRLRWNFILHRAPMSPGPAPRSGYPHYFFYCEYRNKDGGLEFGKPFMNDVGEKIPNWVESARLYAAYTGDTAVIETVGKLVDYALDHGMSPAGFAWPGFPYTTTNAGDLEFRGFTAHKRFVEHEVQVDHAGDMGLAFYRMYLLTGRERYLNAAAGVADVLARKARPGSATRAVWPYRVVLDTGRVTAEYGANWAGSYQLLMSLARAGHPHARAYRKAARLARDFILNHPMRTGYWTDGHSDNAVVSTTYKSNMSASNISLLLLDEPAFDPLWKTHIPELIAWTEKHFVWRTHPGEPATQWGANIVGEQDDFLPKMDYQTARYAAQCARWYAVSGDESYKDRAFRALNWVTYCNNDQGLAFESPVSKDVGSWWSDEYGECPRMFYHAFAAIPEWAPLNENHLLYSDTVVRNVKYGESEAVYEAVERGGAEYLKLRFKPSHVTLGKTALKPAPAGRAGYTLRQLAGGGWSLVVRRSRGGIVVVR